MSTRVAFLNDLRTLNNDVIKMATILEESIDKMILALTELSAEHATEVIARDDEIDDLERKIEIECILIIAKQQPIATDLRKVSSIMKIITDIERIADHCSDISEYVLELIKKDPMVQPSALVPMVEAMKDMVVQAINSYVAEDVEESKKVREKDDIVDNYFVEIREDLKKRMTEDKKWIPQCVDYLMIIKYLERMGDHATNIAGWMKYIVTGEMEE
ncbi:MAG: phosphate signaling complex protein PhoU [Lachnospiraceae bacterium]|nr:phosphate signaling complex protein PhoU [Lachnospiraceae bacterium]MEE1343178.1 phosphate signaling complex protein PhoU [Lachnospiraceae bacterium]